MTFRRLQPAPVYGSTKAQKLEYLRRKVVVCQKCPSLASSRTQTVFGEGNPDAALMFVGEAPGQSEDEIGRPFVGRAGQFLDSLIAGLGLERKDVYIANILKCRPDTESGEGNRPPNTPEMMDCLPYLYAQIAIVEPVVLVPMGATALDAFDIQKSITEARGRLYEWQGKAVVPTFHPAYVLRNPMPAIRKKVWQDILTAWEACGYKVSQDMEEFVPSIGV